MAQGLDSGNKKSNLYNENNTGKINSKQLFRNSLKILSPGETHYQLKSELNIRQRS